MRWVFIISFVTLFVTIKSNGEPRRERTETFLSKQQIEQSEQLVVNLARNFSSDYFQKTTKHPLNPRINSPLSVFIPVSLLSYGARGQTKKDYLSAIGLPENKTETAKLGYDNFMKKLKKYDLQIKTKLFVQSNVTLDPDFSNLSTKVFNSIIEPIEIEDGSIDQETISDWVSAQTNEKISDTYYPQSFGCDTTIVFVNTIYAKASWKVKFDRSNTAPRDFYTFGNEKREVPTMYTVGRFRYGRIDELQANFIELPYKSESEENAMSLFIIMTEVTGFNGWREMIPKLRNFDLNRLLNSTEEEIAVYLPKFRISSSWSLYEPFERESKPVFPFNKTDISGIFESPTPSILTRSWRESKIEVDEESLEIAHSSQISYSSRPCDMCDYYNLRLNGCRAIEIAKQDECNGNRFRASDRKTREAVMEFKVDRPFVGIMMTKGNIFTDISFINFPNGDSTWQ